MGMATGHITTSWTSQIPSQQNSITVEEALASSEKKEMEIAGETQTRGRIVHTSEGELIFEFEDGMDMEGREKDMEGSEEIRTEDTNIMMDIDYN